MSEIEGPLKRWQNLLHGKCPKCNSRLDRVKIPNVMFKCPMENCDFLISQTKMGEIFRDDTHIMRRFLNEHERILLTEALNKLTKINNKGR